MEFFNNMDTNQKVILGLAVVTLVIAAYFFFRPQESMKHKQPHQQQQNHQFDDMPQETQLEDESEKVMVMFSMPGCGHCQNMGPAWQEFQQNFDGYNGVRVVQINGQENQQLAQIHGVRGFPTVKLCIYGLENPEGIVYEGDRSVASLAQFLQQNA